MRSLSPEARALLLAKTVRTFCYGFLGVLFPVYLIELGLGAAELGLAVTATLLASAGLTFAARRPAERHGPRRVLIALAGLIVASAVLFLLARAPWLVVAAAMLGNLAVGTGETGPFLALEQVILARLTPPARLAWAMSLYNLTGYAAAALGAALVGRAGARPALLFAAFLVGGLVQIAAYRRLGTDPVPPRRAANAPPVPASPLVKKLAALFSLDSLAGGFVLQSLMAYWFHTRFDADLGTLGWIFAGAQIVSALSLILAAVVAPRLGLVNTMVFSHLVSNVLLIAMALAPSLHVAVVLLLARHALSQMDVPTRQTFLMLAVPAEERAAAASLTSSARTVAQALSPSLTGWIMGSLSLGAPFLLGGGLKIVYDLWLYATIRNVRVR